MSGYTFPSASQEVYYNPYNPDYLSRYWRAHESGSSNTQLNSFPSESRLTVSESKYYYSGSNTK